MICSCGRNVKAARLTHRHRMCTPTSDVADRFSLTFRSTARRWLAASGWWVTVHRRVSARRCLLKPQHLPLDRGRGSGWECALLGKHPMFCAVDSAHCTGIDHCVEGHLEHQSAPTFSLSLFIQSGTPTSATKPARCTPDPGRDRESEREHGRGR